MGPCELAGSTGTSASEISVRVVAEEQPDGIVAGRAVDEMALPGPPPRHFGEEIESLLNQRRLQPLLRDHLLQMAQPAFDMTVQ